MMPSPAPEGSADPSIPLGISLAPEPLPMPQPPLTTAPAPELELAPAPLPAPPLAREPSLAAAPEPPVAIRASPVKFGRILDEEGGSFALEYDDTRGQKNRMRLDALTYEGAIREARSFLGIQADDRDDDGDLWAIE
jgi:hypothetical protein